MGEAPRPQRSAAAAIGPAAPVAPAAAARTRWLALALRWLLRCLWITWRVERVGAPGPGPAVRALWHGDQLPWILPLAGAQRGVMVSLSEDGSLLAAALEPLGYAIARGSSSRRGPAALRELEDALHRGDDAILAVDGPRGPRHQARRGASRLAARSGAPVVAMGAAAWPAVRLRSWDRFLVPLPFARVVLSERVVALPEADEATCTQAVTAALGAADFAARRRLQAPARGLSGPRWWLLGTVQWALVILTSPMWLLLALALPRWRRGLRERLGLIPQRRSRAPVVWFHAASMGEARVARAVARAVDSAAGGAVSCVLSTTSPEAREAEGGQPPWAEVTVAPVDLPGPVWRTFRRRRPSALVTIEGELWPWLLRRAALSGVPTLALSARVSQGSALRLRWLRPWLAPSLGQLATIQPRTEGDAQRLRHLGAPPTALEKPWDFKAAASPVAAPTAVARWAGERPLWIAGSTHAGEEQAVLRAHAVARERFPGLRLLLAPRRPGRTQEIEGLLRQTELSWIRRTALGDGRGDAEVLILDTLGELGGCYGLAQVAFVGGTLSPIGGHDPLEPAKAGAAVVVGPHDGHIRHLTDALEAAGRLVRVSSGPELQVCVVRQLEACAVGRVGPWLPEGGEAALAAMVDATLEAVGIPAEARRR